MVMDPQQMQQERELYRFLQLRQLMPQLAAQQPMPVFGVNTYPQQSDGTGQTPPNMQLGTTGDAPPQAPQMPDPSAAQPSQTTDQLHQVLQMQTYMTAIAVLQSMQNVMKLQIPINSMGQYLTPFGDVFGTVSKFITDLQQTTPDAALAVKDQQHQHAMDLMAQAHDEQMKQAQLQLEAQGQAHDQRLAQLQSAIQLAQAQQQAQHADEAHQQQMQQGEQAAQSEQAGAAMDLQAKAQQQRQAEEQHQQNVQQQKEMHDVQKTQAQQASEENT